MDIMSRLKEHWDEVLTIYPESRVIGVFCQGSQNYGLAHAGSDLDTKCLIVPSLEDIAFNRTPVSTTHVRVNGEHIDIKDIRAAIPVFRKQNINFVEILFTKYKIVNPLYKDIWNLLVENREAIARYNEYATIFAIYGNMKNKRHMMTNLNSTKADKIKKYGYDSKELSHILRYDEFLTRYLDGEKYEDCLRSQFADLYLQVKIDNEYYDSVQAISGADNILNKTSKFIDEYKQTYTPNPNPEVNELLNTVQRKLMMKGLSLQL